MLRNLFEEERKKKGTDSEEKVKEEKQSEKQANSQLAEIQFLIEKDFCVE